MKTKIITAALTVGLLTGCAGSANHKVVSAHQSTDTELSCADINAEIIKTQVIIDGVNEDKDDVNGADVVDGILWFPFNLIAKHQNYQNALEAADRRIENLQELSKEQNCDVASAEERSTETSRITRELKELNDLYNNGGLTEEEYKTAKQKVLNNISG